MTNFLAVLAGLPAVTVDALIISADVMPHTFVARAHIADLQPSQLVAALCAVEDAIKQTHPHARRNGWKAASDGLYVWFESYGARWNAAPAPRAAAVA